MTLNYKLIVGLGNPGEDYADTRHNIGWKVIDAFEECLSGVYKGEECGAVVIKGKFNDSNAGTIDEDNEVLLAKPLSFMNASGGPVKSICEKYEIDINDIIIVQDDIDLELGKIRIKKDSGSGGHNGIKSIIEKLGTQDFTRVKIGVGRPNPEQDTINYVLKKPGKADQKILDEAIFEAVDKLKVLLTQEIKFGDESSTNTKGDSTVLDN